MYCCTPTLSTVPRPRRLRGTHSLSHEHQAVSADRCSGCRCSTKYLHRHLVPRLENGRLTGLEDRLGPCSYVRRSKKPYPVATFRFFRRSACLILGSKRGETGEALRVDTSHGFSTFSTFSPSLLSATDPRLSLGPDMGFTNGFRVDDGDAARLVSSRHVVTSNAGSMSSTTYEGPGTNTWRGRVLVPVLYQITF